MDPRRIYLLLGTRMAALAALLAVSATAQTTAYKTTHYGSTSGRPADVARSLRIDLDQCPPTTSVRLSGGLSGNLGGIKLGLSKWTLPINGAVSYVQPLVFLWTLFDSRGEANLQLWPHLDRNWIGLKVFVQGLHIGKRGNEEVFAMSEGLEVEVTPKPSTAFSTTTAKLLAQFSELSYNKDLSNGKLWERHPEDKDFPGTLRAVFDSYSSKDTPPAHLDWRIEASIQNTSTSTELFLAKNMTGDVAVVFRGTKQAKDFWTDFKFLKRDGYHKGFLSAYESIEDELEAKLQLVLDTIRDKSSVRIYFSGHSLGGSLATIASHKLSGWLCARGYQPSNVVLYTFGAPRSIDEQTHYASFRKAVPHHYAIAAKDDLVTHIPTASLQGYTHVPNVIAIYPDRRIKSVAGNAYRNDETGHKANLTQTLLVTHNDYRRRVLATIYAPTIGLEVDSKGFVTLKWRWVLFGNRNTAADNLDLRGAGDWVALYRGSPRKPSDRACGQTWDWATNGTSYTTNWGKARDLYVAYVARASRVTTRVIAERIIKVSKRYDFLGAANVWLSKGTLGFLKAHWSNARFKARDWVAVYNKDPRTNPSAIPLWSRRNLNGGSGSALTRLLARKTHYIAFWEKDCLLSPSRLIKVVKR